MWADHADEDSAQGIGGPIKTRKEMGYLMIVWSTAANQPGWLTSGLLCGRAINYFIKATDLGIFFFLNKKAFTLTDISLKKMNVILFDSIRIKLFQSLPKENSALKYLSHMGASINAKLFSQVQWLVEWLWACIILTSSYFIHLEKTLSNNSLKNSLYKIIPV